MEEYSFKPINVYGVQMTSLEDMIFSKYINNQGIAMNTKTEQERKQIVSTWLKEFRKNRSS